MTNMTNETDTIFTNKQLENLPINYKTMVVMNTENVKELYSNETFSKSLKHQSSEYICYDSNKPISNLFFGILKNT